LTLRSSSLAPTRNWGDFRFENPTDDWLLIESWTDGASVIVNLYGADLGWTVESDGPVMGEKFQVEPDDEVVDPELEPGTINHVEIASIGEEVGHLRRVFDRDGKPALGAQLLHEVLSAGNVWKVSPDMKGKSPADPDRTCHRYPMIPAPEDEAGSETPAEPATAV
jgi:hypothetical protein